MLSASSAFHAHFAETSKALVKATLALADGSARELTGDDFMEGGASFEKSTSASGTFEVGACIVGKCSLRLNNCDGRFDDLDFTGSTVTVHVGAPLEGGAEWLRMGVYDVEQPDTYGPVIAIDAYDMLGRLDVPYSKVARGYPASLRTIVADLAGPCGVTFANPSFPNSSYVVRERPDEAMTCRDALSYAAQLAGCYALCDPDGAVRLAWYGDSGHSVGLSAAASMSVMTDDVEVTGVRLSSVDYLDDRAAGHEAGAEALVGTEGYVLSIEDNPFLQGAISKGLRSHLGERLVGMRFRPFEASAVGDPSHLPGDAVELADAAGKIYSSVLTRVSCTLGSHSGYSCEAAYPGRNASTRYGAATKTRSHAEKLVSRERAAREKAIEDLADSLGAGSGLYTTVDDQGDGSKVFYAHDKPELGESQVIWKLGADAFGISTDGGRTYATGLDAGGNAILNKIYAIGLNADYVNAGAIEVRTPEGVVLFRADVDTGQVYLGDAAGGNFWNLSTGEFCLQSTDPSLVGNTANLVAGSDDMREWSRAGAWGFAGGVATCRAPSTAGAGNYLAPDPIDWAAVAGRKLTVSFYIATDASWGAVSAKNRVSVYLEARTGDGKAPFRCNGRTVPVGKAPSSKWVRVAVTVDAKATALGGNAAYDSQYDILRVRIMNESAKPLKVKRVKVEVGATPTAWCLSPKDKTDGIWLEDGELRVSGTVIESDSLSASKIRTGIIAGNAGWAQYAKNKKFGSNTYFNVSTGFLQADKAKFTNASLTSANISGSIMTGSKKSYGLQMSAGYLYGYANGKRISTLSCNHMVIRTGAKKRSYVDYGLGLSCSTFIRFDTPRIVVSPKANGDKACNCFTGTVNVKNLYLKKGKNFYSAGMLRLKFVNGLLVDAYENTSGL